MQNLKAFFLHVALSLGLMLALCHYLPRVALTLDFILRHHGEYGMTLLASAAITRHQIVTWWRVVVMQKAVGAKSRHQRARQ